MARAAKATTVVDEIQNYLNGVAKSLVDRLYGPNGPAWGTRLSELEATVVAIRQHLSERMLHDVLQRQAATVDERPEAFRACPSCGQAVERVPAPAPAPSTDSPPPDPRRLDTLGGAAQWHEPECYCRKCRRSFFPSVQEFGP